MGAMRGAGGAGTPRAQAPEGETRSERENGLGKSAGGEGRRGRRAGRGRRRDVGERHIAGVPARIMRPRLVFLVSLAALLAFGLVMVYSASAVEAASEEDGSAHYLIRQLVFVVIGLVAAFVICRVVPWALFRSRFLWALWVGVLFLLVLVPFVGTESGGATRWIDLGAFMFQPSEFAKPVIIAVVASLLADYYEDRTIDTGSFLLELVFVVGLPLLFIVIEPDMGTTVIILATIFLMLYLAGISYRLVRTLLVAGAAGIIVLILIKPYRLTRFLASLDPWSDPYGSGYQATLAIMAFASGGLFGRGIGNSTMKYNYLPEAHTDYILAIIGEEVGFVGTLIFLAVYLTMIFSALRIADNAPTLHGRLLASGCAVIIGLQAFVNILGILSIITMTGKTLPFISYGGSSMVTSLMLAGIICRVSIESDVATEHDRRRADLAVMSEQDAVSSHLGHSTAGTPHPRSASAAAQRPGFSVVDGGAQGQRAGTGREDPPARPRHEPPSGGYQRVDLSDVSPADRLRPRGAGAVQNRESERFRGDGHDHDDQ